MPPTIAHKMTVDPSQQRSLLQSLVQVLAHLRVSESHYSFLGTGFIPMHGDEGRIVGKCVEQRSRQEIAMGSEVCFVRCQHVEKQVLPVT